MDYQVKLEIFEGPLDLLLHLIHKNEVDIFDIPIATITDQYLEYLEMMRALNISVATDFLVMASTLIHIKSKMLLPDYSEEGDEEDPRMEITHPLLEYMHLKSAAEELVGREILDRDVFTRPPDKTLRDLIEAEGPEVDANIFQLVSAFRRIIEEQQLETRLKIESARWSVKEKTAYLLELLRTRKTIYFREIFEDQSVISELIVTFLALLELVRSGLVKVFQPSEHSDIRLQAKFENDGESNE